MRGNKQMGEQNGGLVELIIHEGQLCIHTNSERARDQKVLTNIKYFQFWPGYRDEAILRDAPKNANAYLGNKNFDPTGGLAIGDGLMTSVVYFHIDEEQAKRAPKPVRKTRSYDY